MNNQYNLQLLIVLKKKGHCHIVRTLHSPTTTMDKLRIAVIADEDTVAGFLLAGVGDTSGATSNFLTVTKNTVRSQIEEAFKRFVTSKDIGVVLITQDVSVFEGKPGNGVQTRPRKKRGVFDRRLSPRVSVPLSSVLTRR